MVRIELEIPEDERERFARQAEREGKTLDAWLISVARQHSAPKPKEGKPFQSREEIWAYFHQISGQDGPEREPDWEEHLRNMDESIRQGLPDV
ncbi:MAG: hypothetical protein OXI54_13405 [Chloroflexota bacterium]|nr:hypothetical protein [Chloroflexota bacterium]MDE2685126.1 hypothetical protein [Chloroflexota bacterium]